MALPILTGTRVGQISRRLESAVAVTRSPFSFSQQVQDWGGDAWVYELQIGPFTPKALGDARALTALLTGLRGSASAFLFEDPTAPYDGGATLGSPLVNGASQTGKTLVTDGWTNGITIPAGMCFSLGADDSTRMYMVTSDVVVDGSGNANLPIVPALRSSPSDNDALEVDAPKVKLRLTSPVPTQIASGAYYTFLVSAVEA